MTARRLSHLNEAGEAHMVDVGTKNATHRIARAAGRIRMQPATLRVIAAGRASKGDVLGTARIAAIQGAKRTSELIPLCHPLPLTSAAVDFSFPADDTLRIDATVRVFGRTGVEMEALTACTVAALTVYDMCKSVDRVMSIEQIRLEEKSGGRSGTWKKSIGAPTVRFIIWGRFHGAGGDGPLAAGRPALRRPADARALLPAHRPLGRVLPRPRRRAQLPQ